MNTNETTEVTFLRSHRVALQPLDETHVNSSFRWINDTEVIQYLAAHLPKTKASQQEWVRLSSSSPEKNTVFAIIAEGTYIGNIGLHRINWKDRTATTGTIIGEKEYWGKGYGTEAKMLLLHYAFHMLNLRKICSRVLAYNERSLRYSMRCGYKEEGKLRQHIFKKGTYWDEILLAVFKEDWEPLWKEFIAEQKPTVLNSSEVTSCNGCLPSSK